MKLFLLVALGSMASGVAMANTFTLSSADVFEASANVGSSCSDEGNVVIACNCADGQSAHLPVPVSSCAVGESMAWGCQFTGSYPGGTVFFCAASSGEHVCDICGCPSNTTLWKDLGSNRVSRNVNTGMVSAGGVQCDVMQSVEYGCAAGYYQSGGSGQSLVCSSCPSSGGISGSNDVGTTDITSCCISNTETLTFSDEQGNGTSNFIEQCCYSK